MDALARVDAPKDMLNAKGKGNQCHEKMNKHRYWDHPFGVMHPALPNGLFDQPLVHTNDTEHCCGEDHKSCVARPNTSLGHCGHLTQRRKSPRKAIKPISINQLIQWRKGLMSVSNMFRAVDASAHAIQVAWILLPDVLDDLRRYIRTAASIGNDRVQ